MPAKPLNDEQKRDAERLKAAFRMWQSALKDAGQPATQMDVAEAFGFGQSALSQYLNGTIPLNAEALHRFASVMGIRPANISPGLVKRQRELADLLSADPDTSAGTNEATNAHSGKRTGTLG